MKHKNAAARLSITLLRWTLCFAIALCSTFAVAQDERDEAREQFQLGNEAFRDGDYQLALEHFQEAYRLSPHDRLLLYIGQAYGGLEDFEQALDYVQQYADTSPEAAEEVQEILIEYEHLMNAAFDRAILIVELAAGIGGELCPPGDEGCGGPPPAGTTPIQVNSTPGGAEVYIDDLSLGAVGVTPLRTEVFYGNHVVIVALPFHEPVRQNITANAWRAGDTIPIISVELIRRDAQVDISFNPVTARVTYITESGEVFDLGTGGFQGELPAGDGIFIMQRGGEERRIERALTGEEHVQVFTLNLDPINDVEVGPEEQGTLVVRSDLPFAEVTVDGAYLGEGIDEFEIDLNPGPHTVRVSQAGYETVVDTVFINEGERQTWRAPTRLEEITTVPWAGIVVTTLGVGATTAGLIMFVGALGEASDLDDCESDPGCTVNPDDRDANDTDTIISAITLGVGGAVLIAGVVLLLTHGPSEAATAPQRGWLDDFDLYAGPSSDGFGLTFDFRF